MKCRMCGEEALQKALAELHGIKSKPGCRRVVYVHSEEEGVITRSCVWDGEAPLATLGEALDGLDAVDEPTRDLIFLMEDYFGWDPEKRDNEGEDGTTGASEESGEEVALPADE